MGIALASRQHHGTNDVVPLSRNRRRRRSDLARRDAESARLAELSIIRQVLGRAVELVDRGWLQRAWFCYRGADGRVRVSFVADRGRIADDEVLSTCLVSAIRDSGPASEQVHGRAVEVTWHVLHGDPSEPVRWCPPPDLRAAHVRDLTAWNDRAGRTSSDVVGLLGSAIGAVDVERRRVTARRTATDVR